MSQLLFGFSLQQLFKVWFDSRYSFLVLDNPNLQDLWNWDSNLIGDQKPLTISKGKIFFHINPKLCYKKIEEMTNYTNILKYPPPWDTQDVSTHSNGDKAACQVFTLKVIIWGNTPEMVGIKFENVKRTISDPRSLLGYLIYYKES